MSQARSKHPSGKRKTAEAKSKPAPARKVRGHSLNRKALEVIFDAYLARHVANRTIVRPAANLAKAGDLRSRKEKSSSRSKD